MARFFFHGCRGFNTYGPWKLIGGMNKGHPSPGEIADALAFYESLAEIARSDAAFPLPHSAKTHKSSGLLLKTGTFFLKRKQAAGFPAA